MKVISRFTGLSWRAALVVGCLVAGRASGSVMYRLVPMDNIDVNDPYSWSRASGVNDQGEVIGTQTVPERIDLDGENTITIDYDYSFTWTNGVFQYQMTKPGDGGGEGALLVRINNNGVGAGFSSLGPALWSNGKLTVLPLPGVTSGYNAATDVNDLGQVIGFNYQSMWPDYHSQGLLWSGGTIIDLGGLGGNEVIPYFINNNGQIVGTATVTGRDEHAFFWQNGVMTDIGGMMPRGLNGSGQVVGTAGEGSDSSVALSWKDGVLQILPALPGDAQTQAWGVNDQGQIVGDSLNGLDTHPVLWTDGSVVDLTPLIDGADGWSSLELSGINSQGWISGTGYNDGHEQGFVLEVVPEPGCAMILAVVGVGGLMRRGR